MALELISFGFGANWIVKLYNGLKNIRGKRKDELNKVNDFLFSDPLELVKYYVEPDCQDTNPADHHDVDFLPNRISIFKKIEEFQKPRNFSQVGNNQMFVFSDAGMGKTSLLAMLKLLHLTSFWPKNYNFVLEKLGEETLDKIEKIKHKRQTVLLLDALDEDTNSFGRIRDRVLEILNVTKSFHRVIITCRTQFFPKVEEDPLERPGLIRIGGYVCPAKYLSLFDDEKVDAYLKKRFSASSQKEKLTKAKFLIRIIGSLRCRPMLLSYIENIMESPLTKDKINIYKIYKALVDSWLIREEEKAGISQGKLLKACEILAVEMHKKKVRDVPESEINIMIDNISELENIKAIDVKGRSLLNRNSNEHYRFSHYSIHEFLVVRYFAENPEIKLENKLHVTDLIAQMLVEICREVDTLFKYFNLSGADLRGAKLGMVNLEGAKLKGADLRGAHLSKAKLMGVDLSGAHLSKAKLERANLEGGNLEGANLAGADLRGARLEGANLSEANLERANLAGGNLEGVNLAGANLQGANLQGAWLSRADLRGANLYKADLKGGHLYCADLRGAWLSRADLLDADLFDADLSDANLGGAKGLEINMLLKVNNLFQVSNLKSELKSEIKKKKPGLFKQPSE